MMNTEDSFNLQRFIDAQNGVFDQVLAELRRGEKRSHWMWFIFPQIRGLGYSPITQKYAISSRKEGVAYLQHPVLGARLQECTGLVNRVEGRSIEQIFGYPDDLKFHSSMTLFDAVSQGDSVFRQALQKYFSGELDRNTIQRL